MSADNIETLLEAICFHEKLLSVHLTGNEYPEKARFKEILQAKDWGKVYSYKEDGMHDVRADNGNRPSKILLILHPLFTIHFRRQNRHIMGRPLV